jgi:replicative DNA helicase
LKGGKQVLAELVEAYITAQVLMMLYSLVRAEYRLRKLKKALKDEH